MERQVKKKRRRVNKGKAGFVPGNIILMVMFSGLSVGCFKDIASTTLSIYDYEAKYEQALIVKEEKLAQKEENILTETKLKDPEYLEVYIRSTMLFTKEGESVFVIQD